jgi:hypothetical protein
MALPLLTRIAELIYIVKEDLIIITSMLGSANSGTIERPGEACPCNVRASRCLVM